MGKVLGIGNVIWGFVKDHKKAIGIGLGSLAALGLAGGIFKEDESVGVEEHEDGSFTVYETDDESEEESEEVQDEA